MDLEFLARIVQLDEDGKYPGAERALREQHGPYEYKISSKNKRISHNYNRISDPSGLVRSIRSRYACSNVGSHMVMS